jgi:hypothetical protein
VGGGGGGADLRSNRALRGRVGAHRESHFQKAGIKRDIPSVQACGAAHFQLHYYSIPINDDVSRQPVWQSSVSDHNIAGHNLLNQTNEQILMG